jgi:hypothetical protein
LLTEILLLIPKNQDIQVLNFVKYDSENVSVDAAEPISEEKSPEFSFFLLIFKNPYLRTAAILTLIAFLLILLFRIGRNQPYVPVLAEKRNRTREFAQTVSALYMSKGRPGNVVELQYVNFIHAIQKHYYLDLSDKTDRAVQLTRLEEKSGVKVDSVHKLLVTLEDLRTDKTSYKQVVDLTREIRRIYSMLGIYKHLRKKSLQLVRLDVPFDVRVSLVFLVAGFALISMGLYLLTVATAIGIIFSLVGSLSFFLGGWRYVHPEVVFSSKYIQIHRMLLPTLKLDWEHARIAEERENKTLTLDVKGRFITLKLSELKPSEVRLLKELIDKLKKGNKSESNE